MFPQQRLTETSVDSHADLIDTLLAISVNSGRERNTYNKLLSEWKQHKAKTLSEISKLETELKTNY